jgi:CheY-like chemotaxis protein
MDTGRSIRILLVDDYRADIDRTLDALRKRDLARGVRVARGGQEALDYLYGRGQFEDRRSYPLPDLILLDLNMPVVDGYMVLRQVKEAVSLKRIPVIVLAMSHEEGRRAMTYESRANSYLVKPVQPESLDDLERQMRNWTLTLDLPPATGWRAIDWPKGHRAMNR